MLLGCLTERSSQNKDGLHALAGRAVNARTNAPIAGVDVRALNITPRRSPFCIPGPSPVGTSRTNEVGIFQLEIPSHVKLEWLDVYFVDVSNLAAMEKGWRIVDLRIVRPENEE